jgi:murein DD-endopeptidase MepM/ murein hydrolase activator NlpD
VRFASALSLRKARIQWAVAVLSAISLAIGMFVSSPAYAVDYPSWDDVQNAKANESAKNAQVANIQSLIVNLHSEDTTATTVSGYEAGVAERARLELIARQQAAAEAAACGVSISDAGWTNPVPNAYISDTYGPRTNFYNPSVGWTGNFHNADHLAAGCGSPVYAASSGTVTYAGAASGYGNLLVINHGGGVSSTYGHLLSGRFVVSTGDRVIYRIVKNELILALISIVHHRDDYCYRG